LKKAAGVLSVLTPWLPVNKVEIDGVSRDPEYLAQAPNDPLCFYGNIVARTGAEIAKAVDRVQGVMDEIRLPLIVLHGGSDRLAETAGGRRLHEQAGAADKTLKLYEGAYHELFNDLDRERFYADLIAWLDAH
ncbi:MAG: alpha/beta hydrolase, partial [Candidatus Hydrogenedentes bacterium]|nr:alpha/beta hydrolase [Candidatus Hydrogenedentota bacterium]